MPSRGCYIISVFQRPSRAKYAKIGYSFRQTVWDRVHSLGLPSVKILCVFPARSKAEAMATERTLHRRFSHLRCGNSEFFALTDELRTFIDAQRMRKGNKPLFGKRTSRASGWYDVKPPDRAVPCFLNGELVGYLH